MKRATVALIDEARCIGCDLCLPPCPVDCIDVVQAGSAWTAADARAAKLRATARKRRLARLSEVPASDAQRRRAILAAALARRR